MLASCKSSQTGIVRNSQETTKQAQSTISHITSAKKEVEVIKQEVEAIHDLLPPEALKDASLQLHFDTIDKSIGSLTFSLDAVVSEQKKIIAIQADQQIKATEVEDKKSPLLAYLKYLPWIAGPIIFIFLWFSPVGSLIRTVFFSITAFIPTSAISSAKLDSEALEHPAAPSELREAVAARRASDPAYRAAFKKIKGGKIATIRNKGQ